MIISVTAGEGHNSVAKALSNCLSEFHEVIIYDLFKGVHKIAAFAVNDGYFLMSKTNIKFSNWMYNRMLSHNPNKPKGKFMDTIFYPVQPMTLIKINEFKPDLIITTASYGSVLMNDFKNQNKCNVPVISINTDYVATPLCEWATDIDYTITPSEDCFDDYIRKGYSPDKIIPLGMPVNKKFAKPIDKLTARKSLNIDANLFTVMIMSGGICFESPLKILKNLLNSKNKFSVIIVNGKDTKMKTIVDNYINEKNIENVYNLGFVDNVNVLMSASDVLISKMGCITATEACNTGLPILVTNKLPWQEQFNLQFYKERNACDYVADMDKIHEYIDKYIENPQILEEIRINLKKIARPNASTNITKFINDLLEKKCSQ